MSPQEFKAYQKERLKLVRVIMLKAEIVFATCIGAHIFGIKEWPAIICLIDGVGCGKDHELLLPLTMFLTLKRAVLADDPYQLGPTIFSKRGLEAWSSTVLIMHLLALYCYTLYLECWACENASSDERSIRREYIAVSSSDMSIVNTNG